MANNIEDFRKFFIGREDAYGLYKNNGDVTVVKKPITDLVLKKHLNKEITIGSYNCYKIGDIWYCKWICIDFDNHTNDIKKQDLNWESLEHYSMLLQEYNIEKENICREFSGRGYHIWIKLFEKTTLKRAFEFREDIKKVFNLTEEIFPKQSTIDIDGYGNWVKLPLSINRKNEKICEILDDFDLSKQGDGYKIPDYIAEVKNEVKKPNITKTNTNNAQNVQEIKNECFQFFYDKLLPCLKAIVDGKKSTHGLGNGIGHQMNMTLADFFIYYGASDDIIHLAFKNHPTYDYNKTQSYITGLRKNIKKTHVFITCNKIRERGFCLECHKL